MTNFIDLKHARVAHTVVGNGPDLVFVHGWPVDSRTYRHLIPELSNHFRCHLIDLPGAGRTIWTKQTPISFEGHCHTLREIVDSLNLSSYALIAHDSGGVIARHLAANDPDRVRGLLLSNTDIPGYYPPTLKLFIGGAKIPGYRWLMHIFLRFRPVRLSKLFGKGMFYDLDQFEGEFGDLFIRPLYEDKEVLYGQMQLIYRWDWKFLDQLTAVHRQIKAPVQLIWGEDDVIFPLEEGREMAREFGSGAEFNVIKNSLLYVHEEQPEQFLEYALPFLQSCFEGNAHDTRP